MLPVGGRRLRRDGVEERSVDDLGEMIGVEEQPTLAEYLAELSVQRDELRG